MLKRARVECESSNYIYMKRTYEMIAGIKYGNPFYLRYRFTRESLYISFN